MHYKNVVLESRNNSGQNYCTGHSNSNNMIGVIGYNLAHRSSEPLKIGKKEHIKYIA